jgi:aerobic C4-dicarboxylate transport protein
VATVVVARWENSLDKATLARELDDPTPLVELHQQDSHAQPAAARTAEQQA